MPDDAVCLLAGTATRVVGHGVDSEAICAGVSRLQHRVDGTGVAVQLSNVYQFCQVGGDAMTTPEAYIVELEAVLGAIEAVLSGQPVSDFMLSFPLVRKAYDTYQLLGE